MRSSLGGDEDQGAEVATFVRDRRRRARSVPDRRVNAGDSRSLTDSPRSPVVVLRYLFDPGWCAVSW